MKTSTFKDYRLNKEDKYHAKEIKALEVFNNDFIKNMDLIVFWSKRRYVYGT